MARKGRKREGKKGVENQYEITLARASAKLQVIKRADKQMKQRETRGAASPPGWGTGTKGGRSSNGRRERSEEEEEHNYRELILRPAKQIHFSVGLYERFERASEENTRKILTSSSNIFH